MAVAVRLRAFAAALTLLAGVATVAGPLPAQTLDDAAVADRLARMQRDIQRLERVLAAPAAGAVDDSSAALARLQVRVSALEQDIRAGTGQVEELGFRLRRLEERLETALADLESRLDRLEAGVGDRPTPATEASPPAVGTVPEPPAPAGTGDSAAVPPPAPGEAAAVPPTADATLPEGSPEQQYAYAYRLLQAAQYDRAAAALSAFLERHPEDDLADNARYWLAETHYVRSDFERAAKAFVAAYQGNKSGPKAPDSLLKLGMSLARIDRTADACTTFAELQRSFPQAPQRITDKRVAEAKRLGCP